MATHPEKTPHTSMPLGRTIKVMIGAGALFLLYVLIAASRPPSMGEMSRDALARQVDGFEIAFPPRPQPPALSSLSQTKLPEEFIAFFWSRECGSTCEEAVRALAAQVNEKLVVIEMAGAKAIVPLSTRLLADRTGLMSAYIGAGNSSLTVIYSKGLEVGRGQDIDWNSRESQELLRRAITYGPSVS